LRELHPVKTDQPVIRTQPEKTVARLSDGEDEGRWQTILVSPQRNGILRRYLLCSDERANYEQTERSHYPRKSVTPFHFGLVRIEAFLGISTS
jgi:hypothetical protein